ncbi:Fic family protein [uncultured Desulfosarcina sp.]|uniref:Fic family protein n=1 Tax=uncultured Desulfosarcina sp. TaxID=218289 RepID=UPI0029C79A60|nr:Fic family protein [uncultured Desulfosarcina sp.]
MDHGIISFQPALPAQRLGELKDMAQEVIVAAATLEGRIAKETAQALGDRLRFLNSYHSNLIEGHKTTICDIEAALEKDYSRDEEKRYVQELCAAHVNTERTLMQKLSTDPPENICSFEFVSLIHRTIYEQLPKQHQFTHSNGGFTNLSVMPGKMRQGAVSLDGGLTTHGPDAENLPATYEAFSHVYDPFGYHGDERLIAAAASHHRMTWMHPFRDGNGRVCRLFSGLYMASIGINRGNLWSLSRGFSRDKQWYMTNLQSADSPDDSGKGFDQAYFADYCMYFLEVCLDQIRFTDQILALNRIDARIDGYLSDRDKSRGALSPLDTRAGRLLKALFLEGTVPRGKAQSIMGMDSQSDRHARRIVSQLVKEGLAVSASHRAPLMIGFPAKVLRYYFPDLFGPEILGEH